MLVVGSWTPGGQQGSVGNETDLSPAPAAGGAFSFLVFF